MPYIKQENRDQIDPLLNPLINKLALSGSPGDVTYVIFRILARLYWGSFATMALGLGILSAVGKEYYRRIVVSYEDGKIKENGDVL